MENSNDPEYIKKNFEAIKMRFRLIGVGGVLQTDKKYADNIVNKEKEFEDRKSQMSVKKGVVTLGSPPLKNNALDKKNHSNSSSIKIFTLGGHNSKEKGKK